MNFIFKSGLLALMLAFTFIAVSGKEKIELSINPATGELTISCGMTTKLGNVFNRKVSWEITDTKIDSFQIIAKDAGGGDPFTERPGKKHGKELELQVRFFGPVDNWPYKIIWFANGSSDPNVCDPIIAVRPVASILLLFLIIVPLFAVLGYIALKFRRKK
ncbi:MAG: hypothetical protein ABIR19_07200 [Ginsengibacter sp.]